MRTGVKFKDADLLGIPVRVTIGDKNLKENKVEIKLRAESENEKFDLAKAVEKVVSIVNDLKAKLNVDA